MQLTLHTDKDAGKSRRPFSLGEADSFGDGDYGLPQPVDSDHWLRNDRLQKMRYSPSRGVRPPALRMGIAGEREHPPLRIARSSCSRAVGDAGPAAGIVNRYGGWENAAGPGKSHRIKGYFLLFNAPPGPGTPPG